MYAGSRFAAETRVLDGLSASTHVTHHERLRQICRREGRMEVLQERFVVPMVDERGLRTVTAGA